MASELPSLVSDYLSLSSDGQVRLFAACLGVGFVGVLMAIRVNLPRRGDGYAAFVSAGQILPSTLLGIIMLCAGLFMMYAGVIELRDHGVMDRRSVPVAQGLFVSALSLVILTMVVKNLFAHRAESEVP